MNFSEFFDKNKKIILIFCYALFVFILAVSIFLMVNFLIENFKKEEQLPSQSSDLPASPFGILPSAPKFLKISGYYFSEPYPLRKNSLAGAPAIFSVLCKKNNSYDIIYLGETDGKEDLTLDSSSKCWIESCGNSSDNIYAAVLFAPQTKKEDVIFNSKIIEEKIIKEFSPACSLTGNY